MKLLRPISLVLLCIAFVPSVVMGEKSLVAKAKDGDAISQYRLGLEYLLGRVLLKNHKEAEKWLLKAAKQGHIESQDTLGGMYRIDLLDYEKAVKWYLKASEQGHAKAQYELGMMYYVGKGVRESNKEAFRWVHRSAVQGEIQAQSILGIMYFEGQGIPKNYVQAYMWLNLASGEGWRPARDNMQTLVKKMTSQQIAEAQRLSAAFKPRKEIPNKAGGTTTRPGVATSLPDAFGSGFYVTSNGYLLTNQHVVNGARKVFISSGTQRLPAQVVKTDAANDLALLKVSGTFAALPVSSSRRVKLGQTVSTVGFPNPDLQGKSPKLTKGEISSLSGASDDPKYFQISVPLQPGNSGGPLVDAYGNVIGVVTAKLSTKAALATAGTLPENVNYAVKGTFVMGFLESVPEVAAEMLDPKPRRSREFTEVVSEAEKASVMILVYE